MPAKVLIIRFSSIGDIVLTTPVIRCVKDQLEGEVEVHFLVKEQFAEVIQENPYITKVHTIKKKVLEVIADLKAEHFDYVVDLHNNIRSKAVKRQLKGLSFTVDKINWQKWLMVNFKINKLPNKHIVDRYMDTVKQLGVQNDGKGLDHFIPKRDVFDLKQLPESHQNGFVAFVIGGTYTTKKLPVEKMISICKRLEAPVILIGGKEDEQTGNEIADAVGEQAYNACSLLNINQSASIVAQSKRVITHDTGMMHIAAAFKKDITSIWGNTIPEFGMYPYLPLDKGSSKIVQVEGLSCRPCTKLGYARCPKKHFDCMYLINEEEVACK